MATVLSFLVTSGVCISSSVALSFEEFASRHGRSYLKGSSEYEYRRELFSLSLNRSRIHNANPQRLWTACVNKFSDWTREELQSLRGWDGSARPGASAGGTHGIRRHSFLQAFDDSDLPKEKSWSDLGFAKDIRNQADCGSCWAIAVATVLEGHAEIHGNPRTFSAQQIVMCTPNPRHCGGDGGCKGATAELGMDWVLKNGVAEEAAIPYTGHDGSCVTANPATGSAFLSQSSSGAASFGMTGWETLPKNEYMPLARALAEKGPVAVSVAADKWFDYDSGIFNGCGKDNVIDHAVVAMGYGETDGQKYWIIQNSWGSDWGEQGHIRLERHPDGGYCGMNKDPQKGVACQGETDPVPVCGMCGILFDSVVPHFA